MRVHGQWDDIQSKAARRGDPAARMIGVSGFQFATDRGNTTSAGRNLSPGVVKLPLTNERGKKRDAACVWLKLCEQAALPWTVGLFVVEIRASFFLWREFDRAFRNATVAMSDSDEWFVRRLKCTLLATRLWIFMRSWKIEERKNVLKLYIIFKVEYWYFIVDKIIFLLSIKIWIWNDNLNIYKNL